MEQMARKGEWRSAVVVHGALSVMISGGQLMLKLCVTNWALPTQVHIAVSKQLTFS